jgi:hypothetical protein
MWQQKRGRGQGIVALTAVVTLLAGETFADPPLYAPYGAWRGRIRYAEGPFGGVRTRVHWGNGITPVGGQVLGQLITVGGAFLTSPNFGAIIGAGTGEGSNTEAAEQEKAAQEAESAEIDNLIVKANNTNQELLTSINELRDMVNATYHLEGDKKLKPLTLTMPAPTQLPGDGGENPNGASPAPAAAPTPAGASVGNSGSVGNSTTRHPAAAAAHLPAPLPPAP